MVSSSRHRRPARALLLLAGCLVPAVTSCRLVGAVANAPGKMLAGSPPPSERVPPSAVQAGVMRFADTFVAQITQATLDFAEGIGTPEARIQAMSWAVGQNTAALTIASGSNPNANLLDMVVLVTLGRMVHEEHWLPKVWGEADRPMLETYQKLEADAWEAAGLLLKPEQQEAVRSTLQEWREKNPDLAVTAFVRLPAFQDMLTAKGQKTAVLGELGSLLSLDPLSGLEPTTREIEQTRLFAERTLFYLQRVPLILPIQAELLGLKLAQLPEVRGALEDSERISLAATSLAATAASLPEAVRVEREAALQQIGQELTAQRQGLLQDIAAAEGPTQQMLVEARATLEAGTQMSSALQGTLQTLDTFIGRFDKGEEPAAAAAPAEAPAEPSKPFDISDYGAAAARIGDAASELDKLVTTLDRSLPEAQRLLDEVAERGQRAIDHAFRLGLALGATLITAAALAVLAVRWISARWRAGSGPVH